MLDMEREEGKEGERCARGRQAGSDAYFCSALSPVLQPTAQAGW